MLDEHNSLQKRLAIADIENTIRASYKIKEHQYDSYMAKTRCVVALY